MKIAMLGHKRIPSREGGVEIVVDKLSTLMVKKGHSVVAYNRSGKHVADENIELYTSKEYEGVELKNVFTIDKKGLAAMTSSFFAAICVAFGKYDIVHFHAEGPCAMIWIPKLFGKRVIATIHGLDWQRAKWGGFATKYLKFGEKMAANYADEVIVLSKNVQKYFMNTYGVKTKFIPNGIDRLTFEKAELIKENWNLSKDEYILFLGRIVPEKGIEYLIKAFKNVKTEKKLIIAGGSSDTLKYFEEMRELAQEDERIKFVGFVRGKILEELYSNAYIYVLPSDLEGMPISLLEAMSFGNCCLVSDIPECSEVVEEKAITFKKGDIDDLRNKLQNLCDNEETVNEYKRDSSNFICNKYNWNEVVDKTLGLYKGEWIDD